MLPEYLATLGHQLQETGGGFKTNCPLHRDQNPSLQIYGSAMERFHCFPCDVGGDVFDLSQKMGRSKDFRSALIDVRKVLAGHLSEHESIARNRKVAAKSSSDPAGKGPFKPSIEEFQRIWAAKMEFPIALFENSEIIRKASKELGFDLRLIQGRSAGLIDGLGIYDGRLCYVYESGLKVRRFKNEGAPRFYWEIGKATKPWRIAKIRNETERVVLCEGETDALACLISGLEDDGRTAVVASPGIGFRKEWIASFKNQEVIVSFDFDEPGRNAAERVATLLHGTARSVSIVPSPITGKETL
jgi:hypothetical protein